MPLHCNRILKVLNDLPTSSSINPLAQMWEEGHSRWTKICVALLPPEKDLNRFHKIQKAKKGVLHSPCICYLFLQFKWRCWGVLGDNFNARYALNLGHKLSGSCPDAQNSSLKKSTNPEKCSSLSIPLQFTMTHFLKHLKMGES